MQVTAGNNPDIANAGGNAASATRNAGFGGFNPEALNTVRGILRQLQDLIRDITLQVPAGQIGNRFAPIDGIGNNRDNPNLGSTNSPFGRLGDADFGENGGLAGADRPNAREISNAVAAQDGDTENSKGASDLFWQWGQFIDHDLTATGEVKDGSGEEANIAVPRGDPQFDPRGTGEAEIEFTRSPTVNVDGQREISNELTVFLDGSAVYGSDKETADSLRSFDGGRLAMSHQDHGNMMPEGEDGMFMAGDHRANEQSGLTAMHTLWVREHNRTADKLAAENPTWGDERLYQEARRLVSAQIQHITYNEFLPTLLGEDALGEYEGYDPDVDPTISNEFSTAAFRFGHTMLSPTIQRLDENGETIPEGDLSLRDAFFNPDTVRESGIDPIIRGQAEQVAQALDPMIIDDVRNTLFGPPGSGGLDLAALNIQRGRDHGLPSWNDTRENLGLERIESFDDPIFEGDFGDRLAQVYDSPDEVDLWVGGLAEQADGDAMVGKTFKTILTDQFERLRAGDRFWHENTLNDEELAEVGNTSLSDVIERNTDVDMADDTAMIATDSPTNGFVPDDTEPEPTGNLPSLIREMAQILQSISEQLRNRA